MFLLSNSRSVFQSVKRKFFSLNRILRKTSSYKSNKSFWKIWWFTNFRENFKNIEDSESDLTSVTTPAKIFQRLFFTYKTILSNNRSAFAYKNLKKNTQLYSLRDIEGTTHFEINYIIFLFCEINDFFFRYS